MSIQGGGEVQGRLAEAAGTNLPPANENNGQGSEETPSEYSLAGDFLKGVPDEHRPILEPYVKKWDAGVTRRFQEQADQFRPYKDLGIEPDVLPQVANLYNMLQENPEQVYQLLKEEFEQEQQQGGGQQQNFQQQTETLQGLPPEFQQFLNPFQQKLDKQEEVLRSIAQVLVEERTTKQQAEEERQLEEYMGNLKTEFGDFDEEYVLQKIAAGMNGDQAVKSFRDMIQKQTNQAFEANNNAPALLSGGGTVPAEQQSVTDLSSKDTKALVSNLLQRVHQGQQ